AAPACPGRRQTAASPRTRAPRRPVRAPPARPPPAGSRSRRCRAGRVRQSRGSRSRGRARSVPRHSWAMEVLAERLFLLLIRRTDALAVEVLGDVEHPLEGALAHALTVLDHERNLV